MPGAECGAEVFELAFGLSALVTRRAAGDLRVAQEELGRTPQRHRRLVDGAWTIARQVHGAEVVVLARACDPLDVEADAIISGSDDAIVAVLGADCPLVGLVGSTCFGVVHAGWRGLLAGVVEAALATMGSLGATQITAVLGPCIHPECYPFGEEDLARLVERLGPAAAGRSATGAPAANLPGALDAILARHGLPPARRLGGCTSCSGPWFSHRGRGDRSRHALALFKRQAGRAVMAGASLLAGEQDFPRPVEAEWRARRP